MAYWVRYHYFPLQAEKVPKMGEEKQPRCSLEKNRDNWTIQNSIVDRLWNGDYTIYYYLALMEIIISHTGDNSKITKITYCRSMKFYVGDSRFAMYSHICQQLGLQCFWLAVGEHAHLDWLWHGLLSASKLARNHVGFCWPMDWVFGNF